MSGSDDDLKSLLREISRGISIQNDKLEYQHERNQYRQQVLAVERANFLVSLGVLSGLLTYYFRTEDPNIFQCFSGGSGPLCALLIISISSVVIFIPGKLLTTTLRPLTNSELLNKFNDIFLPAVNVFLVIGASLSLIIYALFPNFRYPYFTEISILAAIGLSTIPAYFYTKKYHKIMKKVRTASTQRDVIVTSSSGDSDGKIRLTNPNSKPIPRKDVEIDVQKREDVHVEVGQTIGNPNSGDTLNLAVDLDRNTVMDLPVTIEPLTENPQGEIIFDIEMVGQSPQRETISYGVSPNHSGATNIG